MSEVKRVLKSIGSALLVLISGVSIAGAGMYCLSKISEKQCMIFVASFVALMLLGVMSLAFYKGFGPSEEKETV